MYVWVDYFLFPIPFSSGFLIFPPFPILVKKPTSHKNPKLMWSTQTVTGQFNIELHNKGWQLEEIIITLMYSLAGLLQMVVLNG